MKSKIEVLSQNTSTIYGLNPMASLRLISAITGGRSTVVGITKWAPAWQEEWSRCWKRLQLKLLTHCNNCNCNKHQAEKTSISTSIWLEAGRRWWGSQSGLPPEIISGPGGCQVKGYSNVFKFNEVAKVFKEVATQAFDINVSCQVQSTKHQYWIGTRQSTPFTYCNQQSIHSSSLIFGSQPCREYQWPWRPWPRAPWGRSRPSPPQSYPRSCPAPVVVMIMIRTYWIDYNDCDWW